MRIAILVSFGLILFGGLSDLQSQTIVGTVADEQGVLLPGATMTIAPVNDPFSSQLIGVVTSIDGAYSAGLEPFLGTDVLVTCSYI